MPADDLYSGPLSPYAMGSAVFAVGSSLKHEHEHEPKPLPLVRAKLIVKECIGCGCSITMTIITIYLCINGEFETAPAGLWSRFINTDLLII